MDRSYTIAFNEYALVRDASHQFGRVTLDLQGSTYSIQDDLLVGHDGPHDAELTILGGTVQADSLEIADDYGTIPRGVVMVTGPGTRLEIADGLRVGTHGDGSLTLTDGAQLAAPSSGVELGRYETATGQLRLVGQGTSASIRGMNAGQDGAALVLVDEGAALSTTRIVELGKFGFGAANVVIRGAGSRWDHTKEPHNSLNMFGDEGDVAFGVLDDGIFQSDDLVSLGAHTTLYGDGIFGGEVESTGAIRPGGAFDDDTQAPIFAGIGQLDIAGSLQLMGTLHIELGGTIAGLSHDVLAVTDHFDLEGDLSLSLVDGFIPAYGDLFEIVQSGSVDGTFENTVLPDLPGNLSWTLNYDLQVVTLRVVPLPSTSLSLLIAGALLRRR